MTEKLLTGTLSLNTTNQPNMFPFWVSMVDRDWSQGKYASRAFVCLSCMYYRNDHNFSDRQAWANSADPDQTAQGLHCLQFHLHLLEALLYGKTWLFKF